MLSARATSVHGGVIRRAVHSHTFCCFVALSSFYSRGEKEDVYLNLVMEVSAATGDAAQSQVQGARPLSFPCRHSETHLLLCSFVPAPLLVHPRDHPSHPP